MGVFFFLLITVDQLPLFSNSVWFVQLQREERQGGGRRSSWKQPERGTSPLCVRWSAPDPSDKFGRITPEQHPRLSRCLR